MNHQHTHFCTYPQGCSCGASEWNRLESQNGKLKFRVHELEEELKRVKALNVELLEVLVAARGVILSGKGPFDLLNKMNSVIAKF
jgi:hypothetical protein